MAHRTKHIEIVPYRDSWAAEFRAIAPPLRTALGSLALRIDHIGSTSVPGLPAKDVIDMQLTVAQLDAALDAPLGSLGYTRRADISYDHVPPGGTNEPGEWTKLYFDPPPGRDVHLHVRVAGRANQRYALLFRDFLRANDLARDAYGQVKVALARLHPDDVDAYYEVKDPVCDIIMAGAEGWAAATGWRLGPSDL